MIIDNVKKLDELDSVLRLANSCFQLPENGSTSIKGIPSILSIRG